MDRVEYQSLVIQDLFNYYRSGELNLTPWYQRRSVWTTSQKSYLINTLHENKPIPELYIRHSIDLQKEKSIKEIVDGQQRSRAILEYLENVFAARHPKHIKKVKFSQLTSLQRQTFLITSIPIGYLLGATDADVIDIFGRINSVSKTLNPQEKRNAKFSGEFKQFALKYAAGKVQFWRQNRIFTEIEIARMAEVQFISDLVVNLEQGLSDFNQAAIDKYYGDYEDEFPLRNSHEKKLDRVLDLIGNLPEDLIAQTIFRRQPVFFSLFFVVNEARRPSLSRIENAIRDIDTVFNDKDAQDDEDDEFVRACTSTTQRISQRTVRHEYIASYF
jgi:uncharacterized protein DUF262